MDICILIPAYNESKKLPLVINKLIHCLRDNVNGASIKIVVINDGSTDQTECVLNGITVLKHDSNLGKGAALRTGIDYAKNMGFNSILTMDADLQHDPSDVLLFIKDSNRVAFGARHFNREMPWLRRFVNSASSLLCSVVLRTRIPDVHCGLRKFPVDLLQGIKITSNRFDGELELVLKIFRRIKSGSCKFLPIRTIYTEKKSSINPLWDTANFIKMVLKHGF